MMSTPKIGIVIQARMGSSRLPGKVLMPFYGKETILELIVQGFQKWSYPIVIATTTAPKDVAIAQLADKLGVFCVRGSDMNAVDRFLGAVREHNLDFLVRVCADNPFLSQDLFAGMIKKGEALNFTFDYLSYRYDTKPVILTHFGFFVELVNCRALEKIAEETDDLFYLEHITNYLYYHPEKFRIQFMDLPKDFFIDPDIRLTVDTPSDFELSAKLYKEIKTAYGDVEIGSINAYLKENPQWIIRMREQIYQNPKK